MILDSLFLAELCYPRSNNPIHSTGMNFQFYPSAIATLDLIVHSAFRPFHVSIFVVFNQHSLVCC